MGQLLDGHYVPFHTRPLVRVEVEVAHQDETGDFCERIMKTFRGVPQNPLTLVGVPRPNTAKWWACFLIFAAIFSLLNI